MYKRILSFLLALLMVGSMFPAPVFAEQVAEPATVTEPTTEPATEPAIEPVVEIPCNTCGQTDCTSAHTNWCSTCQKDDCGVSHTWCDICQKNDCGVSHSWCDTCQKNDCGMTHTWCDTCQKNDCGVTHKTCETCGTVDCTTDHSQAPVCDVCGQADCTAEHILCSICGEYDCTSLHFYCEICSSYSCSSDHPYCNVCGIYDCTQTHVWCTVCGTYDCGEEHQEFFSPDKSALTLGTPTLTEGAEVSITDESGAAVTEAGLTLADGGKILLGAWSALDETAGVSRQWQIRINKDNDLWVNIQGQTDSSILISAAMILSAADSANTAAVRCQVAAGEKTLTSAAIPLTVVKQAVPVLMPASGQRTLRSVSLPAAKTTLAADVNPDDLTKSTIVIQYVFEDGRTAASSAYAEITTGSALQQSFTLPTISGYRPSLETNPYSEYAFLDDGSLKMDFPQNVLTSEITIFKVVYSPTNVDCTVIHYWQNITNDNYVEHERETINTYITGQPVEVAHETYDGFYHLLYEQPLAAADGSTVIEVYYDRYYYLMKFDLGGGYGVDPVYARYGADLTVAKPTRPGYIFKGWSLDGSTVVSEFPTTIPHENRNYIALWEPGNAVEYTVVYWRENADDNNYSYWHQHIQQAVPGTIVSGSDSIASYVSDEQYFTYNDRLTDKDVEIKGDGSSIINVYYNRNYYTLTFYYNGDCNIQEHTHDGTSCTKELICGQNGHTHSADCARILVCKEQEHIHTEDCLTCGKTEHTAHTDDCLTCTKTAHTHSDTCCTKEEHIHTPAECCSISEHTHSDACCEYGETNWLHRRHSDDCCKSKLAAHKHSDNYNNSSCNQDKCGKEEHDHSSDCTYCKDGLEAHTHSEEENCYRDTVHTHTEVCYDHSAHQHTEACYKYLCGEEPHEHDSFCYSACTKFAHSHGNSCQYGGNSDIREYKIFRTIVAKYEENITNLWPTANEIEGFAYWKGSVLSNNQSSKIATMTGNICINDGAKFVAYYDDIKYTLNYWFEHFDQTVSPDGTTYKRYNNKIYKRSEAYSQTVYYGDTNSWGYKTITGLTRATNSSANKETGNVFNLYYNRNRWDLNFHNVNKVIQTETDVMFEQPLANYEDAQGNLLRNLVPSYPVDSYEPGTMQFVGWYTTPECYEGTQADFDVLTMPNSDLTLYAKWEPVVRTVRFYLSENSMTAGKTISQEMQERWEAKYEATYPADSPYQEFDTRENVSNGSYLLNLSDPGVSEGYGEIHPYKGYTFVGWFYVNDAGNEAAFDPENMPVNQDLDLYAKWNSNVLCQYNVYFALDQNGDGIADLDSNGNIIYIADPITGSGIAGRTRTFSAKGGKDLYTDYQESYFPTVDSHSITIDVTDTDGTGANSFTFLYREIEAVPYTVRYLEKGTDKVLDEPKTVSDNKKAIVTENFLYIKGYMPDAYQKTLVVTADGTNEIIFWYTADTEHALYVVNHYIQNLGGSGWSKYSGLQEVGIIGEIYEASALTIEGFTLDAATTNQYNTVDKKNGVEGTNLPADVTTLTEETLSGKLQAEGLELNFYYTRNQYPYEFRYMLSGTSIPLAEKEDGIADYGSTVTKTAKKIQMDLDGDGVDEDYRLYDPTESTKSIQIKKEAGDTAKINVATFYYVRCTQDMTITKTVVADTQGSQPDDDQEFDISLQIHATNGYHLTSYAYSKDNDTNDTEEGTLTVAPAEPDMLHFTLKDGQSITIKGLPTAVYTIEEQDIPLGYYDTYSPNQTNTLTEDNSLKVDVTNTFAPAGLTISKTVDVVEDNANIPEVTDFAFTITVPEGIEGTFPYTISGETAEQTATVANGSLTVSLKNGQSAHFANLPVGTYAVAETDYSAQGYNSYFSVNAAEYAEGNTANVTLERGKTQTVNFKNMFPVGDLTIQKTVTKEFYRTPWEGDTFTFTVVRTNEDRPLIPENSYDVYEGETKLGTSKVDASGKLDVTITFAQTDLNPDGENSAVRSVVIKNLPAGTYSVTEAQKEAYVQTPDNLTVSGLTLPAAQQQTAAFTNRLIRPTGSLTLSKELVAEEGENGFPDDANTKFSFTITLTEEPPEENIQLTAVYNQDGTETTASVNMVGGAFTVFLEAGQEVTIQGLPVGKYKISEASVPNYTNQFAHLENSTWVVDQEAVFDNGDLYTEIDVTDEKTATVKCVNTYMADRAELILQKLVTKEYDRDVLPEDNFTFTVTLEEGAESTYSYTVYNKDAQKYADYTAAVTNSAFTVTLKAGQYAVIPELPVCGYTVAETENANYSTSYQVYESETGETPSTTVTTGGSLVSSGSTTTADGTFQSGKTQTVVFKNQYKKHLGSLTITKTVTGYPVEKETFLFHITGNDVDLDVTIDGGGSITVFDLPLGSYAVTEDTSWSWRYTVDNPSITADLTLDNLEETVAFINTFNNNKWLNNVANKVNEFKKG